MAEQENVQFYRHALLRNNNSRSTPRHAHAHCHAELQVLRRMESMSLVERRFDSYKNFDYVAVHAQLERVARLMLNKNDGFPKYLEEDTTWRGVKITDPPTDLVS